ncbi:MAG: hypothetical protein V1921_02630 [Candidatus Altiarchaeota archaeon]
MEQDNGLNLDFSEKEFLSFFNGKFGDFFERSKHLDKELEKSILADDKHLFEELISGLSHSLESACFHYFLFQKMHSVYSMAYSSDEKITEKSKFHVLLEFELDAFILSLRGSLDSLAKLFRITLRRKYDPEFGFGNLFKQLKNKGTTQIAPSFEEYLLVESYNWIFTPQKPVTDYEKELQKYSRTQKEYGDIIEILSTPKLNELRRYVAHGRKRMSFHSHSETIFSITGNPAEKTWCHRIPNKPFLRKGDEYTSVKTLDWMDKTFSRTLEFHLSFEKMLIDEINSQKQTDST